MEKPLLALHFQLVRLVLTPVLQGAPCFLVSLPQGPRQAAQPSRTPSTGPRDGHSSEMPWSLSLPRESPSPCWLSPSYHPSGFSYSTLVIMTATTYLALTCQALLSFNPHNSSVRWCCHPILQVRKQAQRSWVTYRRKLPKFRPWVCLTPNARSSENNAQSQR